ncbi:type VI secretion system baseplate subunit TssK [Taibaiella koreensis]|uniref:type VI secretion system baseplate subunit TssK n=1 Tax=Taibaiella koreensis TaxID=1268548 RepID=UPI000E59F4D4|nr:type VI secretion system baseplate subunit TssK [Taibaiella koreensis]
MRSQRKYFPVNWMDGMKINKDHFIAQDNAWQDALSDMATLCLSPLRYGVMPPSAAGEDTFHVKLSLDNQNTLKVAVLSLQAVTPGGVRIQVPGLPSHQAEGGLTGTFPFTASGSEALYWIVLTAQPFERVPSGNPDATENPPRYPLAQPAYQLQVTPESQYNQYARNPFALIIGKVIVNGDTVRVEEYYIPPCLSVQSSPDLMGLHSELDQFLAGLELRCSQIVQKIFRKSQQNDLSELALFLCDRIMLFIGQAITELRWNQVYEPPAKMFSTIVSLARVMKNTIDLRIGSGKEELMSYLSEWCELNPGELEQMLSGLAGLRYEHNDINSNIMPVIRFAKVTGKLFESLSNLEFIGKRKESGIFVKEEQQYQQNGNNETPKPKRRFFG